MDNYIEIKYEKPIRLYSGEMWKTNKSNKQRLAIDFKHRCAYCDDLDKHGGGYNSYHVEHFAPKEKFSNLEFTYDNLLYSCPFCNLSKSNKWISEDHSISVVNNKGFLDPCEDEYYIHLKRGKNGNIVYTTELGKYIYEELKLYLKRHEVIFNLERISNKIKEVEMKINEKDVNKQKKEILEVLFRDLCVTFYRYYDALTDVM